VQHAGRDDVVRVPAAVEQLADLERVEDERSAVGLAPALLVQLGRELERAAGERESPRRSWGSGRACGETN
jgi:hypothetical protein